MSLHTYPHELHVLHPHSGPHQVRSAPRHRAMVTALLIIGIAVVGTAGFTGIIRHLLTHIHDTHTARQLELAALLAEDLPVEQVCPLDRQVIAGACKGSCVRNAGWV